MQNLIELELDFRVVQTKLNNAFQDIRKSIIAHEAQINALKKSIKFINHPQTQDAHKFHQKNDLPNVAEFQKPIEHDRESTIVCKTQKKSIIQHHDLSLQPIQTAHQQTKQLEQSMNKIINRVSGNSGLTSQLNNQYSHQQGSGLQGTHRQYSSQETNMREILRQTNQIYQTQFKIIHQLITDIKAQLEDTGISNNNNISFATGNSVPAPQLNTQTTKTLIKKNSLSSKTVQQKQQSQSETPMQQEGYDSIKKQLSELKENMIEQLRIIMMDKLTTLTGGKSLEGVMEEHLKALKQIKQQMKQEITSHIILDLKQKQQSQQQKAIRQLLRNIQLKFKQNQIKLNDNSTQLRELSIKYKEITEINGFKQNQNIVQISGERDLQKSTEAEKDHIMMIRKERKRNFFSQKVEERTHYLEDAIHKLNVKIISLQQRTQKIELNKSRGSKILPKIDQNNISKENINLSVNLELIRSDLRSTNEDLRKTNERLHAAKEMLNNLYSSHSEIPSKFEDIYMKLREYNELQEDRLLELIKQLINRCLTDPFNNNFTNNLKREINVKFLQIKHEYACIWKQIESKVEEKADKKDVAQSMQRIDQQLLELRTFNNKKCDIQDYKKGFRYLQSKMKELLAYVKGVDAQPQEKKHILGPRK